jgi:hypothetical protein
MCVKGDTMWVKYVTTWVKVTLLVCNSCGTRMWNYSGPNIRNPENKKLLTLLGYVSR